MEPIYIPLPTPFVRYDKTNDDIFTHIGTLVCRKEACTDGKHPMYKQLYRLVQQDGMLVDSDILADFEVDANYPILGIAGDTLPATNKFILRYAYYLYYNYHEFMAKGDSFDLAIAPTAKDLAIHKITLNMYPASEQYELRLIAKATGENEICFDADYDSDLPFGYLFDIDENTPEKNEEIITGRIFREMELILGSFAGRLHKKIKVKTKLTKETSTFNFPSWFDVKALTKKLIDYKSDKIEFVDA